MLQKANETSQLLFRALLYTQLRPDNALKGDQDLTAAVSSTLPHKFRPDNEPKGERDLTATVSSTFPHKFTTAKRRARPHSCCFEHFSIPNCDLTTRQKAKRDLTAAVSSTFRKGFDLTMRQKANETSQLIGRAGRALFNPQLRPDNATKGRQDLTAAVLITFPHQFRPDNAPKGERDLTAAVSSTFPHKSRPDNMR
jgi:hypothetical protein